MCSWILLTERRTLPNLCSDSRAESADAVEVDASDDDDVYPDSVPSEPVFVSVSISTSVVTDLIRPRPTRPPLDTSSESRSLAFPLVLSPSLPLAYTSSKSLPTRELRLEGITL